MLTKQVQENTVDIPLLTGPFDYCTGISEEECPFKHNCPALVRFKDNSYALVNGIGYPDHKIIDDNVIEFYSEEEYDMAVERWQLIELWHREEAEKILRAHPYRKTEGMKALEETQLKLKRDIVKRRLPAIDKIILRNFGMVNPENIDDYITHKGFHALKIALKSLTSEKVVQEIEKSGLRKREGKGLEVGEELNISSRYLSDQKYVVCTTMEGDPALSINKKIIEGDPLSIIEGMIITGYATGSNLGYIYCLGKDILTIKKIKNAISQAEKKHYLGENILGSDFSFTIEVKEGNGDFACLEESALIASLCGKEARCQNTSLLPSNSGKNKCQTLINNVETFANIVPIILNGSKWYRAIGSVKSKGTKIFQITSENNNEKLIEVPMGTPIKEVIKMGGKPGDERSVKAVNLGGPLGYILSHKQLDTPLDFETMENLGIMMGSGGFSVMDYNTDMAKTVKSFLEFTHKESCGKSVPCRIGSKRMLEILTRITEGKEKNDDMEQLQEIALVMKDSASCFLGQNIPNPVLSFVNHFH